MRLVVSFYDLFAIAHGVLPQYAYGELPEHSSDEQKLVRFTGWLMVVEGEARYYRPRRLCARCQSQLDVAFDQPVAETVLNAARGQGCCPFLDDPRLTARVEAGRERMGNDYR
jgi:hypothetical protein